MLVKTMDEQHIQDIGHAFGYYDYGEEKGMASWFRDREAYQGQGYMRKVMDIAFAEGDRLGIPVILDTDAKSKCEKYVHLGMELYGTRDLGEGGTMYDLIRYPKGAKKEG